MEVLAVDNKSPGERFGVLQTPDAASASAQLATGPDTVPEEPHRLKRTVAMHVGYVGTAFRGLQKNGEIPNDNTIEGVLEKAVFEANLITESNYGFLRKIKWTRNSRTDKGVHSLCTVIGLRILIEDDEMFVHDPEGLEIAARINAHLPPAVCVFSVQRVNKKFNSRRQCFDRTYEYYLPAYWLGIGEPPALEPALHELQAFKEQEANEGPEAEAARVAAAAAAVAANAAAHAASRGGADEPELSPLELSEADREALQRFRTALSTYVGRHPFHNYTARRKSYLTNSKSDRAERRARLAAKDTKAAAAAAAAAATTTSEVGEPATSTSGAAAANAVVDVSDSTAEDAQVSQQGQQDQQQQEEPKKLSKRQRRRRNRGGGSSDEEDDVVDDGSDDEEGGGADDDTDSAFDLAQLSALLLNDQQQQQQQQQPAGGSEGAAGAANSSGSSAAAANTAADDALEGAAGAGVALLSPTAPRRWLQSCGWKTELDERDRVVLRHYRTIVSFTADDPRPLVPGGVPCLRLQVRGESFMLHQIRHMIGGAVSVARGMIPLELLKASLSAPARVTVPRAPPHTLFLSSCTYRPFRKAGAEEAQVAQYSGESLTLRQGGQTGLRAFRKQVFDYALNEQLSHPEWAVHNVQLAWFDWPQEQQQQVLQEHAQWLEEAALMRQQRLEAQAAKQAAAEAAAAAAAAAAVEVANADTDTVAVAASVGQETAVTATASVVAADSA